MARQATNSHWRMCHGCGRERRLVIGTVMSEHNRWDLAVQAMVPCEGSGREPSPQLAPPGVGDHRGTAGAPGRVRRAG